MVFGGAAAALGAVGTIIWRMLQWSLDFTWNAMTWVTSHFHYDRPRELFALSLGFLAVSIGILFLFGGAGIAGSDWDAASGNVKVGSGTGDFGSGFFGGCIPGQPGDIDCDGIEDALDGDRDGDGIGNQDDTDPDNPAQGAEGGTPPPSGGAPPDQPPTESGLGCPNYVCEDQDSGTVTYLSSGYGDGIVYCGVPDVCLDLTRDTCPNYLPGDSLCSDLPSDRRVVVGTEILVDCLSEFCGIYNDDYLDEDGNRIYRRAIQYIEDEQNCPADCTDSPNTNFCRNGMKDEWEDGVDCGGGCPLQCQCFNGENCRNQSLSADGCVWRKWNLLEGRWMTIGAGFVYSCCANNRCLNDLPSAGVDGFCNLSCVDVPCNDPVDGGQSCNCVLDDGRTSGEAYYAYSWTETEEFGNPGHGWGNWTIGEVYPLGETLIAAHCATGNTYDVSMATPAQLAPENRSATSRTLYLEYLG
jgi:hypothetical protein